VTFGGSTTQNDPHTSAVIGAGSSMPRPPWERAAIFAAMTAKYQADSDMQTLAQGFIGIEMVGDIPPAAANEFSLTERDILGSYGLATCYVNNGKVYISRARTTYVTDDSGADDPAYMDQRTLFILMRMSREDRTAFMSSITGAAIVDDDATIGGGAKVTSESDIKAFFAGQYAIYESAGLVTDAAGFLAELGIDIPAGLNQIRITYPPRISGYVCTAAVDTQFILG
jgi:phage tail sheath gpL-like